MYDNLVKQLRYCATTPTCRGCMWIGERCLTQMKQQAADAIEGLTAYVRQIEELRKDGYYLQKTKMMTYGQATMTMPLPESPKEEME